jgi:serine/threonine protein kinase
MLRRLPANPEDDKAEAFLKQEAPITKHLRHEPITGVRTPDSTFSVEEDGISVQYLVYEGTFSVDLASYFQGSSDSKTNSARNSLPVIQTLFASICHVFQECHSRGLAVGTLKLASVFLTDKDLAVLSLPRTTEVCHPGPNNNHHNISLPPHARVAFGNDIVILGYILGFMLTSSRPNIRTMRAYSEATETWIRQSCIEFPNLDSIKFSVRRILESCVNTTPTHRPTVQTLLTHSALRPQKTVIIQRRPIKQQTKVQLRPVQPAVSKTAVALTRPKSVESAIPTDRLASKRSHVAQPLNQLTASSSVSTEAREPITKRPYRLSELCEVRLQRSPATSMIGGLDEYQPKAVRHLESLASESVSAPGPEDSDDATSVATSPRSSPEPQPTSTMALSNSNFMQRVSTCA